MRKNARFIFALAVVAGLVLALAAHGAVTDTNTRRDTTGDGSTKAFTFTFPAQKTSDIEVYVGGVKQITGYTVTLATSPSVGGTVTFTNAPGAVAVRIQRTLPIKQEVVSPSTAKITEKALDRVVMQSQQINRRVDDLTLGAITGGDASALSATGTNDADRYARTLGDVVARTMNDVINVKDSKYGGAKGDGVTDDRGAFASASNSAGSKEVFVPPGTYYIASDLTMSPPVRVAPGAVISVASGKSVTFNGGFSAGVHQVFSGLGSITFNRSKTLVGFPEWWGFITNAGDAPTETANLVALQAAVAALPVVQLQLADYFISDTLRISTPMVTLRGATSEWNGTTENHATRIILGAANAGTSDVIFVGYDAKPGSNSNFLKEVKLQDFDVTRDGRVTPPAPGSEITGAAGIRLQYTLRAYIDRVWAREASNGFVLNGTIQTHIRQSTAFRSLPCTSGDYCPSNDIFNGFFLNGNANIGLAGGNASTYLTDCTAVVASTSLAKSVGFQLIGKFVDTFLFRPETTATDVGVAATGVAGSQSGNGDLHIINGIFDQFRQYGMDIDTTSTYGSLDVLGNYFAPDSVITTNAVACVRVNSSDAALAFTNNQCLAYANSQAAGTNMIGLWAVDSSGIIARSNMWVETKRPVILNGVTSSVIEDIITQPSVSTTQSAVYVKNSNRNKIAPVIKGASGKVSLGVQLLGAASSSSDDFNEVNITGIDPSVVTTSLNKLQIAGVAITVAGCYSNAGASGTCNDTYTNLAGGVFR